MIVMVGVCRWWVTMVDGSGVRGDDGVSGDCVVPLMAAMVVVWPWRMTTIVVILVIVVTMVMIVATMVGAGLGGLV